MEVFNTLGAGFMEKVYQEALAIALQERGIPFEREKKMGIYFHNHLLNCPYICDFLVDDKVIVELKAVQKIEAIHKSQLINYLRATGKQVGILLNFNDTSLHPIRVLNTRKAPLDTADW